MLLCLSFCPEEKKPLRIMKFSSRNFNPLISLNNSIFQSTEERVALLYSEELVSLFNGKLINFLDKEKYKKLLQV